MLLNEDSKFKFKGKKFFLLINEYLKGNLLKSTFSLYIEYSLSSGALINKIIFHSLLNSWVYKEMFFDHYSQKSDDKHGPFLLSSMNPEDYLEIDNNHLVEEIIQIVTSPKWSCPSITKEKLTNVKKLLNHMIDKDKDSFFLKKCLSVVLCVIIKFGEFIRT